MLSSSLLVTATVWAQPQTIAPTTPPESDLEDAQPPERALRRPYGEVEKQIRRTFYRYFKRVRGDKVHEQGWTDLAAVLPDDRVYTLLLELFSRQPMEQRVGLLDFLEEHAPDDADVVAAWVAVFDDDEAFRATATNRLVGLVGLDEPEVRVQEILAAGLQSGKDEPIVASASLIETFNLLRAVPLLAQAQSQQRGGGGGGGGRRSAIAELAIGTQRPFVANVTPVVANGAVGFAPTIGVVSTGTVVRVLDAAVTIYREEVNTILVRMTTAATGESTDHLGYNAQAWNDWYTTTLEPKLDAEDKAKAQASAESEAHTESEAQEPSGGG
jgi:hypothetical protein